MSAPLEALRSAKSDMEFWHNKEPLCPHCKHSGDIDRNEWWHLYSDDEPHTVECPACEREYEVRSHAQWTFSTDEQEQSA